MTPDEKRIQYLIDNPDDDQPLDEDAPLLKNGLLHLNWVVTLEGRKFPFVTPSPLALQYLDRHGRLTPADRRTLRSLAKCTSADLSWAQRQPQTT